MKNKKIICTVVLFICVVMTSVAACGKSEKLTGEWYAQNERNGFPDYMNLFSNGTGVVDNGYDVEWYTEKESIKLTAVSGFSRESLVLEYKITGGKLKLTDKNDNTVIYTRKKGDSK